MQVSPRARTALQSLVLAAVGFGAVYLLATSLRSDSKNDVAGTNASALSVVDAAKTAPLKPISVRGFIFVDSTDRVLLCSERTKEKVPFCAGTVMEVRDLDLSRLPMKRGKTLSGNDWAWSDGIVALLGSHRGAIFDARDVLPS